MKNIVFFIEGEEHFRFISPYIEILDSRDYEIKIVTLGNLPSKNLNFTKENSKVHVMLTQKLSPVTTPTLLLQILDTSLMLLPT